MGADRTKSRDGQDFGIDVLCQGTFLLIFLMEDIIMKYTKLRTLCQNPMCKIILKHINIKIHIEMKQTRH